MYKMPLEEWKRFSEQVKLAAQGRWVSILESIAPELRDALATLPKPKHVPCPVHGGKDGFRVFHDAKHDTNHNGATICNTCGKKSDGFETLEWLYGWDFKTSLCEVADALGLKSQYAQADECRLPKQVRQVVSREDESEENERRRQSLNRVWSRTVELSDTIAEPGRLYLARRGLSLKAPRSLRFHPSLPYYDGDQKIGDFPAIVAMVLDPKGQPVVIHRTFLTADGQKAPVESPKKLMMYPSDRTITGGAIRLTGFAGSYKVLAVTEGIETGLSIIEALGLPTWAMVNATLMAHFVPPDWVDQVLVFSDKDRPSTQHPKGHGQEAATALVQRCWAMGKKSSAIVPKGEIPDNEKSLDWLNIYNRNGKAGFPTLQSVEQALRCVA